MNLRVIHQPQPILDFNYVYGLKQLETIVQEIRSYIRHLVDMANSAKKLRVSTVLAMVTASYNQFIDHIDFLGLNGTFDQFIESTGIDPVVPEYFNLDREHLEEDITFFEAGVI